MKADDHRIAARTYPRAAETWETERCKVEEGRIQPVHESYDGTTKRSIVRCSLSTSLMNVFASLPGSSTCSYEYIH